MIMPENVGCYISQLCGGPQLSKSAKCWQPPAEKDRVAGSIQSTENVFSFSNPSFDSLNFCAVLVLVSWIFFVDLLVFMNSEIFKKWGWFCW